jgi:hypothetical protein
VAAPIDVAPSAGAVPPEILAVVPAPPTAGCVQVVTKVNTVADAAAVVTIVSPVYGALVLLSENTVAGVPVNWYHPVVVASVFCVPPEPPMRVVPV